MSLPWQGWYHCMCNTYGTWLRGDERGWRARHHREHVEGDYKHRPAPGTFQRELEASQHLMARHAVVYSPRQRQAACPLLAQAILHKAAELAALVVTGQHVHLVARFTMCPAEVRSAAAKEYSALARTTTKRGQRPGSPDPGISADDDGDVPRVGKPWALEAARLGLELDSSGRDLVPRYVIGKAKSWCSHRMKKAGLCTLSGGGGLSAARGLVLPVEDGEHFDYLCREYLPRHVEKEGGVLWNAR